MLEIEKNFLSDKQSARLKRIMDATKTLLDDVGFEKMTMRDIAKMSGVSPTTLYNRFKTKDQLVTFVIINHFDETIISTIEDNKNASKSPVEQLLNMLNALDKNTHGHAGFVRTLITIHFRINPDREPPNLLYQNCYQAVLSILSQFDTMNDLKAWAKPSLIAEEMSDKIFSTYSKWSRQQLDSNTLYRRLVFGVFSILRAVSLDALSAIIDPHLQEACDRLESFQNN